MQDLDQMMENINRLLKSEKKTTKEDLDKAVMVRPNEVIILPPPAQTFQPTAA